MSVAELIELLREMPQDALVAVTDGECCGCDMVTHGETWEDDGTEFGKVTKVECIRAVVAKDGAVYVGN